jgi:hypothetical protein
MGVSVNKSAITKVSFSFTYFFRLRKNIVKIDLSE